MTKCETCGAEGAVALRYRIETMGAPRELLEGMPKDRNGPEECTPCFKESMFLMRYLQRHPGSTAPRIVFALQRYRLFHRRSREDREREYKLTEEWLQKGGGE